MKATAKITVTHRKEKDVDIYTATNNAYEVELAYIAHLKIKTINILGIKNTDKNTIPPKDLVPFFKAIQQFRKSNDQCTPIS